MLESLKKLDPARALLYIETGAELRRFNEGSTYTATLNKKIQDTGGLLPEFVPIYMWSNVLINRFTGAEHVVFDGTPRKVLEAQLIETVFPFYSLKPHIIYLDVHHEESKKRLLLRGKTSGRKDDNEDAIERRKQAYEQDIHPTIEYFRKRSMVYFHDIDGIGTIEDVHARIVKALGLK